MTENIKDDVQVKDTEVEKEPTQEKIAFTPEQQELINKIISERISKNNEKHEEETLKIIQEQEEKRVQAIREAEEKKQKEVELSKMSEMEKLTKAIKDLQAENENMKQAQRYNEKMNEARNIAKDKGLEIDDSLLATLVSVDDNEKTMNNINSLASMMEKTKEKTLAEAVKGQSPKATIPNNVPKVDPFEELMKKY